MRLFLRRRNATDQLKKHSEAETSLCFFFSDDHLEETRFFLSKASAESPMALAVDTGIHSVG